MSLLSKKSSSNPVSTRIGIVYRAVAELKPDPRNARLHTKRQVKQIARSIEAFGFNVPVLIDGADKIIAGHGRVLACELLAQTEVPTIRLEHLSPEQAKAFMIADNRLTDTSTWNDQLLAEQLQELSILDLDFSLEATGFDMGEIDMRIEGLGLAEEQGELDDIPEPGVPVTKVGDLWQLGPHRILCGNALEEASYATLMAGQQAAMVFTDPPYNVKIDGHVGGNGAIKHREFAMACGEMSEIEFTAFLKNSCALMTQHSVDGSLHFICMDWRHLPELLGAGNAVYRELKNICVWAKDSAGMGSLYRSQHELVLVFKHGTQPHSNNVQLGQYGRNRSNVWRYPGVNSFARAREEGNLLALHPTVKPVALIADAILDCSGRRDIVLDPFLGSGTTLIAAERTGRIAYGMELDPLYVDVAIRRWQTLTGQVATLHSSGHRFESLEGDVVENGASCIVSAQPLSHVVSLKELCHE